MGVRGAVFLLICGLAVFLAGCTQEPGPVVSLAVDGGWAHRSECGPDAEERSYPVCHQITMTLSNEGTGPYNATDGHTWTATGSDGETYGDPMLSPPWLIVAEGDQGFLDLRFNIDDGNGEVRLVEVIYMANGLEQPARATVPPYEVFEGGE